MKKHNKCQNCGIRKENNLRYLCDKCLEKYNDAVVERFLATSDVWK